MVCPNNQEIEIVTVLATTDYGTAAVGKSILDSAGIESFIDGSSANSIFGGFAPVDIELRVNKKDENTAMQLLKELK